MNVLVNITLTQVGELAKALVAGTTKGERLELIKLLEVSLRKPAGKKDKKQPRGVSK